MFQDTKKLKNHVSGTVLHHTRWAIADDHAVCRQKNK